MSLLGMVAVCSASAQTPVPDRPGKATAGKMKPASASTGSSAATSPEDASVDHERALDERRATESKQRIRKRPGYRHEVPSPRG